MAVSKIFAISEETSMIVFTSLNNVFNRENIRSYTYNFNYTNRQPALYSQRTGYIGVVFNF
ncbi:MAG: hypothetical protein Tsb0034_21450 [Ekhidna sp.]